MAAVQGSEESAMSAPYRSLENLSLGGVAAMCPQTKLPKKYRTPGTGEKSTFQGAGVIPVTRLEDGKALVLLWQPQKGKKKGVRWFDFGGRKTTKEEFTTGCACRKFAKETYGIFGCNLEMDGQDSAGQLRELYQGLANLPLMLRSSEEWAKLQLLEDGSRIFYSDIHEYHAYMLNVPYVPESILNEVSAIVDGRKRIFRWMTVEDIRSEVLAPRLHIASLSKALDDLALDPWVRPTKAYGQGVVQAPTGSFSASVVKS